MVTVYGNVEAASVTNKSQFPYPYGSVLVMETASTRKNAEGKPAKDAEGALQKDQILGLHVMRRGKDFQKACLEHSEAQVAIQRDIARHLDRIATALEQHKP